MILKEKQFGNSIDPKLRAGEEAEKQMAFYLQRALGKRKDVFILNDLRVIYDGETAQVDHLVVTRYGLFIIESKSIHGKIIINEHNEWARTFNEKIEGMPSPVLQGQEQGRIIKELLRGNAESLLGKLLFGKIQKGFKYCPVIVYVAISDSGVIERKIEVPELFKADQVVKIISSKLDNLTGRANPLSPKFWTTNDGAWDMSVDEAKTVAEFLVTRHQPISVYATAFSEKSITLSSSVTTEKPEKSFVPKAGAVCPECGIRKLVRKSVSRSDGTETDFLACEGYPGVCKAIFALVAVQKVVKRPPIIPEPIKIMTVEKQKYSEGSLCPNCQTGTLTKRKGKTEFLGCTNYPKCKFTDYRE